MSDVFILRAINHYPSFPDLSRNFYLDRIIFSLIFNFQLLKKNIYKISKRDLSYNLIRYLSASNKAVFSANTNSQSTKNSLLECQQVAQMRHWMRCH